MKIDRTLLCGLAEKYGPSFYLLDTERFQRNFQELTKAFRAYYPETVLAYSYKTNYIPRLCELVNELGGFAEIVSHMEYEIAKRLSVPMERIVFNGPWKDPAVVEEIALGGGMVNLDSLYDLGIFRVLAERHPGKVVKAGIRCNFDVGDGVTSRFGFDVASPAFEEALVFFRDTPNAVLKGLHCHFASRNLKTWSLRAEGMLALIRRLGLEEELECLDLGGGLFGHMPKSLAIQFDSPIPTYAEYAEAAAKPVAEFYEGKARRPKLLIEPGSALAGDVMSFAAPVVSVKNVRGKEIATVLGSIYNINPTLNKKNPPLQVFSTPEAPGRCNLDFGGFTCIESDYLYRHYSGPLSEGDYVVFGNAGSYSIVLKPPFILPNFPVLELMRDGTIVEIKRSETFDDLFRTYQFLKVTEGKGKQEAGIAE